MHTLGVDAAERRRSNNSGMKVEADIMRFGVTVGNMNGFNDESGPIACIDVAQAAEDLGFDSVWTNDHIVVPTQIESRYPYNDLGEFPAPSTIQCFEPLAVMCALAEATQSVEIGCSVLVIPYRHPAVVAKMLAAADQISGGRIVLGAGVGWMREEFEALGLPEVNYRRRGAVTNEYLRAMREIWNNPGPCSFHGQFVEFENVGAYPKPVPREDGGTIPIVIGGNGINAWRRASRYGDGFHAAFQSVENMAVEVEGVRRACERDRRDPEELEIQLLQAMRPSTTPLDQEDRPLLHGSPDQIASDLLDFGRVGVEHLIATPMMVEPQGDTTVERVINSMQFVADEILPAFS